MKYFLIKIQILGVLIVLSIYNIAINSYLIKVSETTQFLKTYIFKKILVETRLLFKLQALIFIDITGVTRRQADCAYHNIGLIS